MAVAVVEGIPEVRLGAQGGGLRHLVATQKSRGVVEHIVVAISHHPLFRATKNKNYNIFLAVLINYYFSEA